jgi:hypothetical protein
MLNDLKGKKLLVPLALGIGANIAVVSAHAAKGEQNPVGLGKADVLAIATASTSTTTTSASVVYCIMPVSDLAPQKYVAPLMKRLGVTERAAPQCGVE